MAVRTKAPLPIPHETLADLQTELATHYGSCVWEGQGDKVLVIRVPRDEPDMIADMENAVETIAPTHVTEARHCVLVGGRKITAVPMEPMRQLMTRRVELDRDQVQALRTILPGTLATHLYRSPDDPKRRLRLGVGLPIEQVEDAQDRDFDELARLLGPAIQERKLEGLHCVYLVASRNHVRLQPGPFVDDILQKWQHESRLQAIAKEREEKEAAEKARRIHDRERLLATLEETRSKRVVRAPMANALLEGRSEVEASPRNQTRGAERTSSQLRGRLEDVEEALGRDSRQVKETTYEYQSKRLTHPRHRALHENVDSITSGRTSEVRSVERTERTEDAVTHVGEPSTDHLHRMLARNGYQVLDSPDVPGFQLTAAAERDGAYPQRLIVQETSRFTVHDAEDLLEAAQKLGPDMALAVGDQIDNEARGLILASKVKWVRRNELSRLTL